MGQIRNYQTDYLRQGSEPITFERYDYDGVFIETINEDILYKCPENLTPLNRDLLKSYDKPLKEVKFITDLNFIYFKNENAHFLYDDRHWILGDGETIGTNAVVTHADEPAKAVSGNKYFKSTVPYDEAYQLADEFTMIKNDYQYTQVSTNTFLNLNFNYFIDGTDGNQYNIITNAWVEETYGGTRYNYNFETKEWVSGVGSGQANRLKTTVTNSWGAASIILEPYIPTADSVGTVYFGVQFNYPTPSGHSEVGGYDALYLDNIGLGQSIEANFDKITAVRKQYDYAGTYTGNYESADNILSNEAKSTEYFLGKITGKYKRTRDTAGKTLEAIITQEILNDSRDFLVKYEGTFRGRRDGHLSLHNKVWIDFGADTLQEPVSCYLDAMKYDVKNSEYQVRMHVPNQDDDVGSTYNVYVE